MGRLALVFAGQGAQTPGMGREIYQTSAAAKQVFDECEATLPGVKALCFEGPKDQLNLTVNTQPCLFAADMACANALLEVGVKADGVAGFSLGEVAAASYAGFFDQEDAFEFVRSRAEAMHECSTTHPGTMFAVFGLPASQVETLSLAIGPVYPVNYNYPGQTVVACPMDVASAVSQAVVAAGGKAVRLAVSGAFHSALMNEAAHRLAAVAASTHFETGSIPVYANVTGRPYGDPKTLLAEQVNHPVHWQLTIENMIADGFDTFVEVGPGTTLTSFISKINPSVRTASVRDHDSLIATRKMLDA
ncbi:MAG: ACP S-malonyltransferase [Propionibacteriaceae bacterium]|nr:ACP S-malonyltransferase [Propionibacteriaceae bacterium]